MKQLLETESFPQFCNYAFWCRWDRALIHISILFLVCFSIVKIGKAGGILFGPEGGAFDIATASLVGLIVLVISIVDKKRSKTSSE